MLLAAALLALGTGGSASAEDVPRVVVGDIGGDEVVPLQIERMVPGSSATARYVVERGSGLSGGAFAVEVEDVRDLERGCNRPERNSGDVSCGDEEGELSRQLVLGHAWSQDVDGCGQAAGPSVGRLLRAAEDLVLSAPAAVSDADEACLVLTLELPSTADNLVQSDLVQFDLRLGLTDAEQVPDSGVLPIGGGTDGAGSGGGTIGGGGTAVLEPRPSALPMTGVALLLLLAAGAGTLTVGAALLRSGRRVSRTA